VLTRPLALSLARLAFATTAIVAMTYQFATSADTSFRQANFFSFFTIQSNILGVAALFLLVVVPRARRNPSFDGARSAVVLYMALVGVVFALLCPAYRRSSRRRSRGSTSSCTS
jgi:FtsH-binding integral membrane protein